MKDLAKTYAPIVALAVGAFIYWSIGTVAALNDTVAELREQNKQITIAITANCEAAGFVLKPAEVSESAGSPDTVK